MNDLKNITRNLADSPIILDGMLAQIHPSLLKQRRIEGKWSIHEHACHLVEVQKMLNDRFQRIKEKNISEISPYLPGKNIDDSVLIDMNLENALQAFHEYREKLLNIVGDVDPKSWNTEITHPEYTYYTPYILLRHILMHDHLHMYRIEELWLTTDSFLS
jgi:uncharacterized damage-inducible protein DinB